MTTLRMLMMRMKTRSIKESIDIFISTSACSSLMRINLHHSFVLLRHNDNSVPVLSSPVAHNTECRLLHLGQT